MTTETAKFRSLPAAIKKDLQNIRMQGNSLLENLYQVMQRALEAVQQKDWRRLERDDRNALWQHVVREARDILVTKEQDGKTISGWSLSFFNHQIHTVRKAILFGVDVATAAREDMNFLQESYDRAYTFAGKGNIVTKVHMERSMKLVRAARERRMKHVQTSAGYNHFVLPNPGNYAATDGDMLASRGYDIFSAWLDESKSKLKGSSGYEQLFASVRRLVSRFKAENQSLVKGYATDIDTAPVKNGVRTASKPSPAKKGNATPVVAY